MYTLETIKGYIKHKTRIIKEYTMEERGKEDHQAHSNNAILDLNTSIVT